MSCSARLPLMTAKMSLSSKGPVRGMWWLLCSAQPGAKSCHKTLCANLAYISMKNCVYDHAHAQTREHTCTVERPRAQYTKGLMLECKAPTTTEH